MEMVFKIEIRLGNDAVTTESDVADLLREFADKIASGKIPFETEDGEYPSGPMRDKNGNKVGEWEVARSRKERWSR